MAAKTRDSGICCDNDCESQSSATSSSRDHNQLSYVQRLRKRFECLAKEQEREFHSECNWWLAEQDDNDIVEVAQEVYETKNENFSGRNEVFNVKHEASRDSSEFEAKSYSKQSSIKSQISRESSRSEAKLIITPATPVKSPTSPIEYPAITFTDYQGANETNDSDSFDSDEESDEEEVFEDSVVEQEYFPRKSGQLRITRPVSITSQTSNVSSKLHNIVRELLENEENYVRSLKAGIDNYMTVFDRKDIPKTLRGQKHRIFANIRTIYNFHQHEFLPALVRCDDDPEQIAEVFTNFVTRDFFYGYIIYAINRKRSEKLCNSDISGPFWKNVQNECGDRLGINSFLLQPIQRLPRYQLLINEIIKDLSKDLEKNLDNTKQVIAACCVAEKNMQRLIIQVNESMSINDIRNCYEIDVLDQGKFKKMDEFDIYDWELRRRFRGKVFLFERGVIYTEALNREFMEFRGHLGSDVFGIIYKEGKTKFKLFARSRGKKEVEFRASLNTVIEWNEIITGILMNFVEEEKKKNASRKNSLINLRPITISDNVRSSMISTRSDQSFQSMSSYRSSSGNSRSSSLGRENSFDPRRSQWYI